MRVRIPFLWGPSITITHYLYLTAATYLIQSAPSLRLYETCEWEPKQIRRLISNGQLAARLRGTDSRLSKTDRECPICFMYYSETNISKCCNATLCTECYLQIKPGKDRYCICPFCNNPKMQVRRCCITFLAHAFIPVGMFF